ncbi:MAG: hypothetical protein ACYDBY_01985 [Thermoanaerobaculia bacterium]
MSLYRILPRASLGALTLGAVVTLVAPLLPLGGVAQAGEEKEETTITISTSRDKEATVLKLEPMKPGETKTVTSEAGKPVTVTRTEDGYTVRVGEREIEVKTKIEGDGPRVLLPGGKEVRVVRRHLCGDDDGDVKMLFVGDGDHEGEVVVKKRAFAYHVGEGAGNPNASEVLKKAAPKSLESLDSRTRGAVEQVLQELIDAGDVLAPRAMPMVWHAKEGEDGERVKVMVVKEKKEEGAKE